MRSAGNLAVVSLRRHAGVREIAAGEQHVHVNLIADVRLFHLVEAVLVRIERVGCFFVPIETLHTRLLSFRLSGPVAL